MRVTVALLAAVAAAGCGGVPDRSPPPELGDADAARGAAAIERYGCGGCHVIPGIERADGHVGPPLTAFSRRTYVAGELVNDPENLARWIRDPQRFRPGTAMPDLGVREQEARDIAAYLFTLR